MSFVDSSSKEIEESINPQETSNLDNGEEETRKYKIVKKYDKNLLNGVLSDLKEKNPNVCKTHCVLDLMLPKDPYYLPRAEISVLDTSSSIFKEDLFSNINLIEHL